MGWQCILCPMGLIRFFQAAYAACEQMLLKHWLNRIALSWRIMWKRSRFRCRILLAASSLPEDQKVNSPQVRFLFKGEALWPNIRFTFEERLQRTIGKFAGHIGEFREIMHD